MSVQHGVRKVLKLLGKSQAGTPISLFQGTQLWGIPCCWDGGRGGWCLYGGLQTPLPMTPGGYKGQSIHVTFCPLVRQKTLSLYSWDNSTFRNFFVIFVFAFISPMKKKRKLLLITCVLNLTIKVIQQHFYPVPIIIMIIRVINWSITSIK